MKFCGKVFKYGDDVNTDVIIPARYLNVSTPSELAKHCMEDIDKGFATAVKSGDIVVGGHNFGCGSSREHAPIALKASGVSLVIAASYARIFYRNAVNIGLDVIEDEELANAVSNGDILAVDRENKLITNRTNGKTYKITQLDGFIQTLVGEGGLIAAVKKGKL